MIFTKLSQNSVLLSAGVLECITVNPLTWLVPFEKQFVQNLALKESHLLLNFVKYEILQLLQVIFKDFKAIYGSFHMS